MRAMWMLIWPAFLGLILSPCLWAEASYYTERLDDPQAVYLTAEAFGVHGDGAADDAPALQAAIDKVAATTGTGVLFVPEGTYRLGRTVYVWPGVRLIGYGAERPVFVLGANTLGFQEGDDKVMLFFSGGRSRRGDEPPRDGGAGTFYGAMSNIDIEIGPGNPAAVGVRFHVAQHCYLAHMDFRLGTARAGLEDIGNEVEDLHFHGGQYGIITGRSAPGWPILAIDCTFEGQSVAAISDEQAGLTLVRPSFKNVPTAVSLVSGHPDELWVSDARLENVTGPAFVVSNENNARMQINLENLTCRAVPTLARFRTSGKTVPAAGPMYVVERFSHGLHLGDLGSIRQIETTVVAHETDALPAVVASDIPDLPARDTWVNVRTFGVAGDGKTDDTAALKAAMAAHRTLYFPIGWYHVTDTLTLKPDTVLIGLNPAVTVINLPDGTAAFQNGAVPKAVIEAPRGGRNIVAGLGVYTGTANPAAVAVKWMAGAASMVNDVRLHGGHGTTLPDGSSWWRDPKRDKWNSQHASLWVTSGGGGTFKDIWTPSPYSGAGLYISDTSTSGRLYAMSSEHHVDNEVIIRNAANWRFYALQFEEEREEGPKALPLLIERSRNIQFANTFFYRVVSSFVPSPYAVKVVDSSDIRFRNVHCYSNSKVSFDNPIFDATLDVAVRDNEFAVLDLSGKPVRARSPSDSPVLATGAGIEKLADGFLNITGAAVDEVGSVYFADARQQRIYRWSPEKRQVETVREIPQQPVQLVFDKAANLIVVAYEDDGTVLTFDPRSSDSEIVTLKPAPAAARPDMTPVLVVNRWTSNAGFMEESTTAKPFHYVSLDGSVFLPAGRDFTTGAVRWGTKLADLLRAFGLAPVPKGRPFYVTNEAELKTWAFDVKLDGTLFNPRLFVEEGGEGLAIDAQGNVYLAAGQILVFDPAGRQIDTIEVPQRPTCLVFGGEDRRTLFITARSALYGVRTRFGGRQ